MATITTVLTRKCIQGCIKHGLSCVIRSSLPEWFLYLIFHHWKFVKRTHSNPCNNFLGETCSILTHIYLFAPSHNMHICVGQLCHPQKRRRSKPYQSREQTLRMTSKSMKQGIYLVRILFSNTFLAKMRPKPITFASMVGPILLHKSCSSYVKHSICE